MVTYEMFPTRVAEMKIKLRADREKLVRHSEALYKTQQMYSWNLD